LLGISTKGDVADSYQEAGSVSSISDYHFIKMLAEKKTDDGKNDTILATVSGKEDDIETGHISSLDEAELFLREHGISHSQLQEMLDDPAKSRRIRRRVDLILLPLLCGTYALQYIDKQVSPIRDLRTILSGIGSRLQCGL
jgi:hypothetical protein